MSKQPSKKSFKLPITRFPRISRFITEPRVRYVRLVFFGLITLVLVAGIVIRLAQLREGLMAMQLNSLQRQELISEKGYWEDVLERHPGYRDAAFKLAVLSFRLGSKDEAKKYIDVTLQIDPNFKQGRVFVDKLN